MSSISPITTGTINPVVTEDGSSKKTMTQEEITAHAQSIVSVFDDGFQLNDIFVVIKQACHIVEDLGELPWAEKKVLVEAIVDKVIDLTDGPGPDAFVDPVLKVLTSYAIDFIGG